MLRSPGGGGGGGGGGPPVARAAGTGGGGGTPRLSKPGGGGGGGGGGGPPVAAGLAGAAGCSGESGRLMTYVPRVVLRHGRDRRDVPRTLLLQIPRHLVVLERAPGFATPLLRGPKRRRGRVPATARAALLPGRRRLGCPALRHRRRALVELLFLCFGDLAVLTISFFLAVGDAASYSRSCDVDVRPSSFILRILLLGDSSDSCRGALALSSLCMAATRSMGSPPGGRAWPGRGANRPGYPSRSRGYCPS